MNYFDIIKDIGIPLLAIIITYWATNYKFKKEVPIDKMEFVYDNVYYPISDIIKDINYKEINIDHIEQIDNILIKNKKYVDNITLDTYKNLKESKSDGFDEKHCYNTFKKNINDHNSQLRTKLGYPKSSVLFSLMYPSSFDKYNTILVLMGALLIPFVIYDAIVKQNTEIFITFIYLLIVIVFLIIIILAPVTFFKLLIMLYKKNKRRKKIKNSIQIKVKEDNESLD